MLLFLVGCGPDSWSNAVTVGASDPVWDPEAIPVVRLTFGGADWEGALESLLTEDDCAERPYLRADLAYENPQSGLTEHVSDVGVRYRGHSALAVPNKTEQNRWGLKIAFDEYDEERRFHDLKKFVLLGTEGDYSLLRERVGQRLMREMGVPAPRVTHARLYVNDVYQGVFPFVEESDDGAYLDHHFPDDEGSLYKVAGYCAGTHMDYEGTDPLGYLGFEPKAGTLEAAKADDLIPMFGCLNPGISDDLFRECIDGWIDVDEWLTEMAVDVMFPNIDGMASTAQNFLLYRPDTTDRFVVYPYDLDLAFYGAEEDYASRSIFALRPEWEDELPVLPRRLREAFAPEYCARVLEVAEAFEPDTLGEDTDALERFLAPDIAHDPFMDAYAWPFAVDEMKAVAADRYDEVVEEAQACVVP